MDHPRGIEQPFILITNSEKTERRKAQREEARLRGEAIRRAELDEFFRSRGIDRTKLDGFGPRSILRQALLRQKKNDEGNTGAE